MPLRSYLYLDDATVDDYLSEIEGGLLVGTYSATDTTTSGKEGGISAKLPGIDIGLTGKRNASSSLEIQWTIKETAQGKFGRLHQILTDESLLGLEDRLQILNGFDAKIYEGIETGEIIQVEGNARLPKWEHIVRSVSDFKDLAELAQLFGVNPYEDADVRRAVEAVSVLASVKSSEGVTIILEPFGATRFPVVARLKPAYIRRDKEALEARVTLVGKVQRRLQKGQEIEVFRLAKVRGIETLMKLQEPKKGPRGKIVKPNLATKLDEVITFPGLEVTPIAVFF